MLKTVQLFVVAIFALIMCAGCQSTTDKLADSAANKNVTAGGYLMLGKVEVANPETSTPEGKLLIGKLEYRSRKVAVPADQKVPTTGFFKATKTKSLFGVEETVIEYDFTAGSDADAKAAMEALEKKKADALKALTDVTKTDKDI